MVTDAIPFPTNIYIVTFDTTWDLYLNSNINSRERIEAANVSLIDNPLFMQSYTLPVDAGSNAPRV